MDEVKLLPCPFCGGNGADVQIEDDGYAYVICVCTAQGPLRKGEAEAIAAWNHRPTTVVTDEVVERVARAICYWHNPKHGSCFDNFCVGSCRAVKPDQEHYDQARAAIASMPTVVTGEQQRWLPIESAPKDREILLLMPNHGRGGSPKPWVTLGSYLDNSKTQWPWQGWKSSGRGPVSPTHWQPLPEPPAQPGDA